MVGWKGSQLFVAYKTFRILSTKIFRVLTGNLSDLSVLCHSSEPDKECEPSDQTTRIEMTDNLPDRVFHYGAWVKRFAEKRAR